MHAVHYGITTAKGYGRTAHDVRRQFEYRNLSELSIE
jgi:hypothetical protein